MAFGQPTFADYVRQRMAEVLPPIQLPDQAMLENVMLPTPLGAPNPPLPAVADRPLYPIAAPTPAPAPTPASSQPAAPTLVLPPQETAPLSTPRQRAVGNQRAQQVLDQQAAMQRQAQQQADQDKENKRRAALLTTHPELQTSIVQVTQGLAAQGVPTEDAAQIAADAVFNRYAANLSVDAASFNDSMIASMASDYALNHGATSGVPGTGIVRSAAGAVADAVPELIQAAQTGVATIGTFARQDADVVAPVVRPVVQALRDRISPVVQNAAQVGQLPVNNDVQIGAAAETPQTLAGGSRAQQFQTDPASLAAAPTSSGTVGQSATLGDVAGQLGGAAASGAASVAGAIPSAVEAAATTPLRATESVTHIGPDDIKNGVVDTISAIGKAFNKPTETVQWAFGEMMQGIASGLINPLVPAVTVDRKGAQVVHPTTMTPEQRQHIQNLYENGYMAPDGIYFPPGGRAVWEGTIAAMPDDWPIVLRALFHIGTDTALDPLSYLGFLAKAGEAVGAAARAANAAGEVNRAAALNVAGQALSLPDLLFNKSVEKGFDKLRELGVKAAGGFSTGTKVRELEEEAGGARRAVNRARSETEAAGEGPTGQPVPGQAPPTGPSNVPGQAPLAPAPAPTGAGTDLGGAVVEPVFGRGPVVMTPEQRAAQRNVVQETRPGDATRLQQDELIGGRNAGPVTTLTPEQTARVLSPVPEVGTTPATITVEPSPLVVERETPGAVATIERAPEPTVAQAPEPTVTQAPTPEAAAAPEPTVTPTPVPTPEPAPVPTPAPRQVIRPEEIVPPQWERRNGFNVDVNQQSRRGMLEQLAARGEAVLPDQDLKYLDPSYVRRDGTRNIAQVVATDVGPLQPEQAKAFFADYTPLAQDFMQQDRAFRAAAGNAGREVEQSVPRTLATIEFRAKQAALFKQHFGLDWFDDLADTRRVAAQPDWAALGAGNQKQAMQTLVDDAVQPRTLPSGRAESAGQVRARLRPTLEAVLDAAVFGTDDTLDAAGKRVPGTATRARSWLREADSSPVVRELLGGKSPSAVAEDLKAARIAAYGEDAGSRTEAQLRKDLGVAKPPAAVTVKKARGKAEWTVGANLPPEQQAVLRQTEPDARQLVHYELTLPDGTVAVAPETTPTKRLAWAKQRVADAIAERQRTSFLPGSAQRQMAVTDAMRRKASSVIDRLQPKPLEASVDPGYVPERTRADTLYNAGRLNDDERAFLNQEIRRPEVGINKKTGQHFDKGLRERINNPVEAARAEFNQQTLGGGTLGHTTVLDAIDDLVAQGVAEDQIDRIIGRLVAEARGVNVASLLRQPTTTSGKALRDLKRGWGTWRQFIRDNTQFGIHRVAAGLLQDAISDAWTAQAFDDFGTAIRQFNPGFFRSTINSVRVEGLDALKGRAEMKYLDEVGETVPHDLIVFAEGRSETSLTGPTTAGKISFQYGNKTIRPLAPLASEYVRDMRTAGDRMRRLLAFDHVFRGDLRDASARFDQALLDRATAKGADPELWRAAIKDRMAAADKQFLFSPEDVRQATGDEALARAWRSEIKGAKKHATATVNKMYFTYKQTRFDQLAGQVTFFHYWMSRATVMHTEMMLRNPRLMASYWRFWQGVKHEAEREGYPDTLKSYVRFMADTTGGWFAYFDPLSLIIPFTMFREVNSKYAPFYERMGLYLNPMIEAAAAVVGMTENVPNLLGTGGFESRVLSVWNYMQAEGWVGDGKPDAALTQRIWQSVYQTINKGLVGRVPGVKAFQPFDPNAYVQDQLRTLIIARAQQVYGPQAGWSPEVQAQVKAAYAALDTDPRKNDLSKWAQQQWATYSLLGSAMGWVVPVRTRSMDRDQNAMLSSQGYDAINAGEEPTPEQRAAMDAQTIARSGDPALALDNQAYHAIGTPEQQDNNSLWGKIANTGNEDQIPVRETLSGDEVIDWGVPAHTIPADLAKDFPPTSINDLVKMSDQERKDFADKMVVARGGPEALDALHAYQDERKAFREAHPQYAAYNDYQSFVYDYPGGPQALAAEMRRFSPNFDAYLREQEANGEVTAGDIASIAAYQAQRGEKWDLYGPKPESSGNHDKLDAYLLLLDKGGADGGTKKPTKSQAEKDAAAIRTDMTELDLYTRAADQLAGQGGTGLTYNQLEPYSKAAVDQALAQLGVTPPSMSSKTRLYLLWRASVPAGQDNSVEAFLAYLDAQGRQSAERLGLSPEDAQLLGIGGETQP